MSTPRKKYRNRKLGDSQTLTETIKYYYIIIIIYYKPLEIPMEANLLQLSLSVTYNMS